MKTVGLKHWPGKKAEQYTLARIGPTGAPLDLHCRYGMAVPFVHKCDHVADGIPFRVHDTTIFYKGLPILIMEPRDAAKAPEDLGACSIPEYVGCFVDRLYIPGEGSYVVRTDGDALLGVAAMVKQLSNELGAVMDLVPPAFIERVVAVTVDTTPSVAHFVACSLHAYRSGVPPAEAAARHFEVGHVEGVAHELACVVGLFTHLNLVSADSVLGVDMVLGVTQLVHVDTGEPMELFSTSPKW